MISFTTTLELNTKLGAGLSPAHRKVFLTMNNLTNDLQENINSFLNTIEYNFDTEKRLYKTYVGHFSGPMKANIQKFIETNIYTLTMTDKEDLQLFMQVFYNFVISEANKIQKTKFSPEDSLYNEVPDSIITLCLYEDLIKWATLQRRKLLKEMQALRLRNKQEFCDYLDLNQTKGGK